jgi:hypothetical protein
LKTLVARPADDGQCPPPCRPLTKPPIKVTVGVVAQGQCDSLPGSLSVLPLCLDYLAAFTSRVPASHE